MPAALPVISAVATVAGGLYQVKTQLDAESARKEQLAIQKRQQDLQAAKEKAALDRATRIRQASIINNSFAQGVQSSSAVEGGIQDLNTQNVRGTNYINQGLELQGEADNITKHQIGLDTTTAIGKTITALPGAVAGAVDTGNAISNIFK